MFQCLQENIAQAAFGSACRAEVESRTNRMQEDYRLDYSLSSSCTYDVDRLCAEEKVCWPFLTKSWSWQLSLFLLLHLSW